MFTGVDAWLVSRSFGTGFAKHTIEFAMKDNVTLELLTSASLVYKQQLQIQLHPSTSLSRPAKSNWIVYRVLRRKPIWRGCVIFICCRLLFRRKNLWRRDKENIYNTIQYKLDQFAVDVRRELKVARKALAKDITAVIPTYAYEQYNVLYIYTINIPFLTGWGGCQKNCCRIVYEAFFWCISCFINNSENDIFFFLSFYT